jgi:hypothetical protein
LAFKDKETLMIDDSLISDLKEAKQGIFSSFKKLLDEIETIQDTEKVFLNYSALN